jgi:hypothetical protein
MVNNDFRENYKNARQMIVARYEQQVVWRPFWEYKRLGHAN